MKPDGKILYWIWLSLRMKYGANESLRVLEAFGNDAEAVYHADTDELRSFEKEIGSAAVTALSDKSLNEAYSIETYCRKKSVDVLRLFGESYPKLLTNLRNPPIILYAYGNLDLAEESLKIAVVGTRSLSDYGRRTAYRIGYELGAAGAVVVSGMALGIDSVAACGALEAGGKTIAVLGSGFEAIYPSAHKKLAAHIAKNGLLLTEFPPSMHATKWTFPIRNRIISGLSNGTVVVEAAERSGALITARDAILQGRDVFAVPGNVDERGALGTNSLIRDGASAVTSGADILENYRYLWNDSLDLDRLSHLGGLSDFHRGCLSAHGVDEGETWNYEMPDRKRETGKKASGKQDAPISETLKEKGRIDGKTVDRLTGSTEYPVYGEPGLPSGSVGERKHSLPDDSVQILSGLSEEYRNIFAAMPIGKAVSTDEMCELGYDISTVLAAFTLFEVQGLAERLPGSLYVRK